MAAKLVLTVAFGLGGVFILLETVLAIKCFNCNSAHQADCADWFDNVTQHLVECFSWQTKCRKVIQEAWLEDHWDIRYIRQCAGDDSPVGAFHGRVCQERFGSFNVRMRYCHCNNQDGCNSAPAVTTSNGFRRVLAACFVTCLALLVPQVMVLVSN